MTRTRTKIDPKVAAALRAARPIIHYWMMVDMTSNAMIERKERPGSIKDGDHWFNPDTLDDVHALREWRRCQRALKLITTRDDDDLREEDRPGANRSE